MLPENHSFLIRGEDGEEYGPVDLRELRGWVLENRAGLGTEVRVDEPGSPWNPWQHYPELVALLAEAQVTSPVPGQPGLVIAPIRRRIVALMADLLLLSILFIPIVNVLAVFLPMDVITEAAMNPWALQALPPETVHQLLVFQMISNGGPGPLYDRISCRPWPNSGQSPHAPPRRGGERSEAAFAQFVHPRGGSDFLDRPVFFFRSLSRSSIPNGAPCMI